MSVDLRIVFSRIFVTQNEREVCHIIPQLPVCDVPCFYAMDDDHENPGITAIGLWSEKEEYLHRNNRSHSGEPGRCDDRDCIYNKNDVIWKASIIHALTMG